MFENLAPLRLRPAIHDYERPIRITASELASIDRAAVANSFHHRVMPQR
jgi:hypothetical protein